MNHTLQRFDESGHVGKASPSLRRILRRSRLLPVLVVASPGWLAACATPADDGAIDAATLEAERTDTSPVERIEYDCAGLPVEARLRAYSVELAFDGRTERLPRVAAGSGAKYEIGVDEDYRLFWAKGDTARLAIGSDAWRACTLSSPAVPAANVPSGSPAPSVAPVTGGFGLAVPAPGGATAATSPSPETPMPDELDGGSGSGLGGDPGDILEPRLAPARLSARGNEPSWTLSVEPASGALTWRRGDVATPVVFPTIATTETANGLRHVASSDAHEIVVEVERGLCHDGMSGMPYPASATVDIDGETLRGCAGSPVSLLLRTVLPGGEEAPAAGWVIERLAGTPAVDEPTATIGFTSNGRVSGFTGCNRFDGRWERRDEELRIGRVATTRMACRGPVAVQESTLLTLLGDTRRFDVQSDGRLVLTSFDGSTLVARPDS